MKRRYLPALCATLVLAIFVSSPAGSQPTETYTKAHTTTAQIHLPAVSQDECNRWATSHAGESMNMEEDDKRSMYMLSAPRTPLPLMCLVLNDPFPPLRHDNIGTATRTVPGGGNIERFFNQGLQFFYAFNNRESYRAFDYAAYLAWDRLGRQNLSCAWCFVGEALALSPDINWGQENDLDRKYAKQALDAAGRALTTDFNRGEITQEERDKLDLIIKALGLRFADCESLTKACDCLPAGYECKCQDWRNYHYKQAIAAQLDQYKNDPDYLVLFADSVMNQIPWGYWNKDGSPKCTAVGRARDEIKAALERGPQDRPHNGLIHWYIHLMEMSGDPGAAEHYARKLADLAPEAGHLVHMPAHIYYRLGDMPSSIETNTRAVQKDRNYLCLNGPAFCKEPALKHPDGDRYRFGYYPHNIHFELASAALTGRSDVIARASETLLSSAPTDPTGYRADKYRAVYYLTKLNYSSVQEIQNFPKPRDRQLFSAVAYEYAQVFADVLGQNLTRAERNYVTLQQAAKSYRDAAAAEGETNLDCDPAKKLPGDVNLCVVQLTLYLGRARIDAIQFKNPELIFSNMDKAIAIQDSLNYDEPPPWLYPVRQTLAGLILSKSNDSDYLARAMFRLKESLPENSHPGWPIGPGVFPGNAWAYFGLWKIAAKLGRPDEAKQYEIKYRELWKGDRDPEFLRM